MTNYMTYYMKKIYYRLYLGFRHSYATFTAGDQNLDIEYIKIDSLFVFVADV